MAVHDVGLHFVVKFTFNLSLFNFYLRKSSLQMLDAAHGESVAPNRGVQRVHAARTEVQETRMGIASRERRRGPSPATCADERQGS